MLQTGCAVKTSNFRITDHKKGGGVEQYTESFDEAYFDVDGSGNVDVVLYRSQLASQDRDLTEIIRLRSFWKPILGRTVAEKTQINGTVCYAIISGNVGTTFEGAGSLFFDVDDDTITGSLDLALLNPTRNMKAGSRFFNKAELSGTFVAHRDPRRVVRIVNDLNRRFGRGPYTLR